MKISSLKLVPLLLFAAVTVSAQEKPADASPERARANFARPIELAADDVRLFPEAPDGYKTPRAGAPTGKLENFEYDSKATGTRRKALVYVPAGYSPEKNIPCFICSTASAAMSGSGSTRRRPTSFSTTFSPTGKPCR